MTTGNYNTAIGCDAIYTVGTGSHNVAIGAHANFYGTGSDNTSVGSHVHHSLTTGTSNVAIGVGSGVSNTTGSDNVAVGRSSLASVITGSSNTAIGRDVGLSATGSGNVLMGYLSGFTLTTGSNNVLIGTTSLLAASYGQVTTGSRNVSIGVETAVADPTASNQLCISNFIYGTGMSGAGATVSTSGKLGFGVKAPNYFVHANGALGFSPGASVTPVNNGDITFELTNNTTLTIRQKGSDGTVRSGTVTLS